MYNYSKYLHHACDSAEIHRDLNEISSHEVTSWKQQLFRVLKSDELVIFYLNINSIFSKFNEKISI
jgi:hypothetical protein